MQSSALNPQLRSSQSPTAVVRRPSQLRDNLNMLIIVKRERDVGSSSNGSLSHGIAAEDTEATPKRRAAEAAVSYAHEKAWLAVWLAGVKTVSPPVLAACRAALVDSPAASRAALAKYKSSINPPLAKILTTVGSYDAEVVSASSL